ncbi:MAG TPA: glycosyltransferase family 4 protein [Gaiellaceae bacterium]|nr:glycosyltransferase family 4 protein [Gaiellaceae bacterium]
MAARRPRVLILVENQPVPHDKRVWPECLALVEAGYEVVVVCPQGDRDRAAFERLAGVEIHRYAPAFAHGSRRGYLREYATAAWHTALLARRLARERGFDVVHACNPPDVLLLAALPLKRHGTRFVFDHHDLVPELYETRFGGRGLLYRLSCLLERLTFLVADVVISTNESYRRIALERGRKRPEDVFVVRNGPDTAGLSPAPLARAARPGGVHVLAYVGVMGPQDGVDVALHALAHLRGLRSDWRAVLVGDGDVHREMVELARRLGLADVVEFTGFVHEPEGVRSLLAAADVCLAPEPKTPLNDVSTMIKIAEYMAMARPVVAFDLTESRVTAGDAALYAEPNDPASFAACIDVLLDDPGRRAAMGALGRERVANGLGWERSKRSLLDAYAHALAGRGGG